jgi:periplasmic mercuric ion binding protein
MRGLLGLWVGLGVWLYGQQAKLDTLHVKSSVVCQTCRRTIIKGLSTQKGIRQVEVDVPAQVIMVIYRPDKTTPEAIREAIRKLGYDADSLPRDAAAYESLPACCKRDKVH